MNTLTIDGTLLTGIWVDASLSFNKPDKRVETFAIAGRNGDLIIDEGVFDNLVITYPVLERDTFPTRYEQIVNDLASKSGYLRIVCNNDPTHYRLGRFLPRISPTVKRLNKDGYFNLAFDCKPQRFLTSGDTAQTFTSSGSLTNPTKFASKPLIRVYGTGNVIIGDTQITITTNTSYTDIDCEMMDCFRGSTNLNANVSFSGNDFPVLKSGNNNITLGSGITQVIVTPRWFEL